MNANEVNSEEMEDMNSSEIPRISLKKILNDLKSYEINKNLQVICRYADEFTHDKNVVEFQASDYEKILDECMQWVTNYIFHLPANYVDELTVFRIILFQLSIKKLNLSQKENSESNNLRLSIISNGSKLVKLCVDKECFANIDYYINRVVRELDALESFCNEKGLRNIQIIYKRVEITMYSIEKMMKQNNLVEAMEELNRQKNCIIEFKVHQEYFVGLCYNISLKCNQEENYDYALTVLLLAYDVCKAREQLSESMKTILHFLVCICLKYNPKKNWQYAIDALELTNGNDRDIFYIMAKIQFALITQQQNLLEDALNQAVEWEYMKFKDVNQITQLLQKNKLNKEAAEFVEIFRCKPFSLNDKFLLMKLEIHICISANDQKIFSLLENSIKFMKQNDIDVTSVLSLYKLLLSHAHIKFKEKMFKDSLTYYSYCAQTCEFGGLNTSFLHHVQTRMCLCYIELDEWISAKQTFETLKENCNVADPSYIYLALQIAFMSDDEKLAGEVLNRCDESDKIGNVMFSCCHKALLSGKKAILFKILEAIFLKYPTTTILLAKISQCLISLCSDSTDENTDIQEKYLLYMDKALHILQQNPDLEETSELSQWFSRAAWNLALTPDIEPKYTFEFFLRCCCFSEMCVGHLHRLKNSLMLAAASGLHVVRKMNPKENTERDAILGKVMTVIEKCKSLETGTNATLLRLLYLYEFEARCHLNKWDDGNGRVKEVLHLPFMDVKTLEHIAAIVNEFSPNNYQVIMESLKVAVQRISEGQNREDSEASKTYHSLIQVLFHVQEYLSQSVEEENLILCSNLLNLIKNNTFENYPQLEILWLMTKCWNWGVQKLIAKDTKRAYKWCTLAMDFLQKLESLKTLHEKRLNDMYTEYFHGFMEEKQQKDTYSEL